MKKFLLMMSVVLSGVAYAEEVPVDDAFWVDTHVEAVLIRNEGIDNQLFVRTVENPNPANCLSTWSGAGWANSNVTTEIAAQIALEARRESKAALAAAKAALEEKAALQGNEVDTTGLSYEDAGIDTNVRIAVSKTLCASNGTPLLLWVELK